MRTLLVTAFAATLAACTALVAPGLAAGSAPRVVGTWADNQSGGTQVSGGYELWSNGRVVPLQGAAFYGDAAKSGSNDFVGMITDYWSTGYWLITSSGQVFSYGQVCKEQRLVGPAHMPSSGIVGAVNLKDQDNEGFNMVTSTGATYGFRCQ
jgi:hypothetical protein